MPFNVPIEQARKDYPGYEFIEALTPSEQKAAFHVRGTEGRDLCLKIISPDYDIDRLTREIEALQQIDHPNVVRLEEYTFSSKLGAHRHYLIERFVEGSDLTSHLDPGKPWALEHTTQFFAQLCDGLSALKAANVVHRDLKPNNIRVRPDGSPVIIDFGLARHLSLPDLTLTSEGAGIGTPAYFAPEQFDGTKRDIDHRTDLFAVGVLTYEAAVGQHPFLKDGMSYQSLREIVCEGNDHLELDEFKALPDKWRLLIGRLLEKQRANRPHSAEQVAMILRKLDGPS